MTTKADFTPDEWTAILSGPPTAGTMIVMASKGGLFRETIAMAKAYTEIRSRHGASELLDEIVSTKPHVDHTRFHSYEELKEHGVGVLKKRWLGRELGARNHELQLGVRRVFDPQGILNSGRSI